MVHRTSFLKQVLLFLIMSLASQLIWWGLYALGYDNYYVAIAVIDFFVVIIGNYFFLPRQMRPYAFKMKEFNMHLLINYILLVSIHLLGSGSGLGIF